MTRRRKSDCDRYGHVWQFNMLDEVSCARCYQCLSPRQMLSAYVKVHGGKVWP